MTIEAPETLAVEYEGNIRRASDDFLTLAAKSGDGAAFVELGRRHSKRIQLQVYRILGSWEDAEDVLQESLLRAFKHLGQFRGILRHFYAPDRLSWKYAYQILLIEEFIRHGVETLFVTPP